MDPISFTASLLAILGGATAGAKAGAKTLEKISAYRHAPEEISALSAELGRFADLLEQTENFARTVDEKSLRTHGQALKQEVERAKKRIDDIGPLLSDASTFIARLNDERQAKALWMKNKKKIRVIHKDIKHAWVTISHAFGILTAASMRKAVNTSISVGEANSEKISVLMGAAEKKALPPEDSVGGREAGSDNDLPPSTLKSLKRSGRVATEPSWRISSIASPKCRSWCSCHCHSRGIFMTPFMLTTILGHFIVELTTTGPKCNERSCRRSDATSLNLNYNFPQFMSSQHLSFTMDYTPISGAKFSLRMPRVMNWEHMLWQYANHGNIAAVQKLFSERKASPLDVNLLGESALNYAAKHPKLYRFLVENGGDQELTDNHGYKPTELIGDRLLCAELDEEDAHSIGKMLDETDFMETRQFTLIHKIVLGIVRRSLEEELEISTALIDSTDSKGRTPLAWATIRNDLQAVNTLLAYDADPNICDNAGDSCLHLVRSADICSALLQAKADVHIVNKTFQASCLQAVCRRFDAPEVVNLLHGAGADINHRDGDAETPLLNAIFKKHTQTARRLIELGADVNAANYSSHDAAIHFAVSFDHHEILPILLEYGVDYNAKGPSGRNFAHMTAHFAGPQTMRTLASLEFDELDISARDARGKTAADYMAERTFFSDSENETREAFDIFYQSVAAHQPVTDRCVSGPSRVDSDRILLPGAYPK